MQHVFISPPALIVIINDLWKTTYVHDDKMRGDVRPFIGGGITAVVKAGPDEAAQPEIIFSGQLPPGFCCTGPPGSGDVLVGHIGPYRILFINASCCYRAAHFGTNDGLPRMIFVIIGYAELAVIKSAYRN